MSPWSAVEPAPEPGMDATYGIGSDRYAMMVVAVERNGRLILARFRNTVVDVVGEKPTAEDLATYVAEQRKREAAHPLGHSGFHRFTLRGDGAYRAIGSTRGGRLTLGHAEDYQDPSF